MAGKFKVQESSLRQFSKAFADFIEDKLTGPKARANLTRTLKPFLELKINEAIAGKDISGNTQVCKGFRPDVVGGLDLVGQLGIGDGNGTLPEKYTKGWRALLVGGDRSGGTDVGAAKLEVTFAKKTFGNATYRLDKETFYNAKVNNYLAHNKGESHSVPWMRYFIEGEVAQGFEYTEGDFKNSRTGLGIMKKIPSGAWRIPPIDDDPFRRITTAIKTKFSRKTFGEELKQIILKAIN
jgi:hypothetical protein